ncbi:molybdenum cofactor synthesis protein 2B [Coniochaeta sp. 2T2.1]|nr:molybdenum cofactor synthesis protein 2B [Coniochaeta sp. 2T2.1]
MADQVWEMQEGSCYVALTRDHLQVQPVMDREGTLIWSLPGTTRNSFANLPVRELQYQAYNPLALRTMLSIAKAMVTKHSLKGIAMVHRLGTVPIGEESILIAVSSPHRQAAWRAGEEALEECKARVEVWKREEFVGEEGVWRANRDGVMGVKEEKGADGEGEKREEGKGGGEGKGNVTVI